MSGGWKRRIGIPSVCIGVVCLLAAALAPSALAAPLPTKVEVGKVQFSAPLDGRASLLIPVTYPIALAGRRLDLSVSVFRTGHNSFHHWESRPWASSGAPRVPDRRRQFTFVHRIDLSRKLTGELSRGFTARVDADGAVDVDRDGSPDFGSSDSAVQPLPLLPGGGSRRCATVPQLRAKPGREIAVELPACASPTRWSIAGGPGHGTAKIRGGRLIYRSAARFRGADALSLVGRRATGSSLSASAAAAPTPVSVVVGTASNAVVRAMGDSVTAGFGYYEEGDLMPFENLLECKPGAIYNDACSSNSTITNNTAPGVEYSPDYGLGNKVSWAAQWATKYGITNYENLAISGSEPKDWRFHQARCPPPLGAAGRGIGSVRERREEWIGSLEAARREDITAWHGFHWLTRRRWTATSRRCTTAPPRRIGPRSTSPASSTPTPSSSSST